MGPGYVSDTSNSPPNVTVNVDNLKLERAMSDHTKAAVLHDWIYKTHWRNLYTRKQADQIFYEAMLVGKTPRWKAKLMYYGVRLFGWAAWH